MEYDDGDDNEFQRQGFHLTEDSNNFSFCFSKIDNDSLVDTEVLLGIQGQDNNWIEDYSSGTTSVEFSSATSESCLISRSNNVLPKTTSHKLVESSKKSFVDYTMSARKTSTDAHEVQTAESDKPVVILKQDLDNNLKGEKTKQKDQALASDKCQNNFLMADKDPTGAHTIMEGTALNRSDCSNRASNQDDLSSVFENLDAEPGNFDTHSCSDQVVEEYSGISSSNLLSGEGEKETAHSTARGDEVTEQFSNEQKVVVHLSREKDSSFVDSMMLISHVSSEAVYSENPDGLLEAIAYPVKALNNNILEGNIDLTPLNDTCSPFKEADGSIRMQPVEVGSENGSNDATKVIDDDGTNNTTKMIDDRDEEQINSLKEVTEGEQSPRTHFTGNSEAGDLSLMSLAGQAETPLDRGTQISDMKDISSLVNFKSPNPESAIPELHLKNEVAEDVNKPEDDVDVSDSKPNDSHLPPLSNIAGTITSVADDILVNEKMVPSAHRIVPNADNNADVLMEKEHSMPSAGQHADKTETGESVTDHGLSESKLVSHNKGTDNNDDFVEKTDNLPVVGQDADTANLMTDTFNKSNDELATCHPSVGVEFVLRERNTANQQSHPGFSIPVDGVIVKKGTTLEALVPDEQVVITDPIATTNLCFKEEFQNDSVGPEVTPLEHQSQDVSVVEQKDEANHSSFVPMFVQPHGEDIIASANVSSSSTGGNLLAQLSSSPLIEPIIDDQTLNVSMEQKILVDASCQNQPQLLVDKSISTESAVGIQGVQVIDSDQNDKDDSCLGVVFTPANKDRAVNVSGGAQNSYLDSSANTLIKSNTEDHMVEADSGKIGFVEPNCHSPMIISSNKLQDQERSLADERHILSNDTAPNSSEKGGNSHEVLPTTLELKEIAAATDGRSFILEVGSIVNPSEKNSGSECKTSQSMQTSEFSKVSKEKPLGSHTEIKEGKQRSVRRKTPNTDKLSRVTESSNGSPTTPKVKSVKRTPILKTPNDKDARSCNVISTAAGSAMQPSGLPDLSSSGAAAKMLNQPFTDAQQVQLRAQIFVYGSLIQGIPPDEACMMSAVGEMDGGRAWEGVWRASVEKYQNHKSPSVNSETPRSDVRVPEEGTRCSSVQSKPSSISMFQSAGKIVPFSLQNSTPLPSPIWSTPIQNAGNSNTPRGMNFDFKRALSPLLPYYSSQGNLLASNNISWPSQVSSGLHGVPLQGSTHNVAIHYPTVPFVEKVQATPVIDSCAPRAPSIQLVSPSTLFPSSSPLSVAATSVKNEPQRKTASTGTNKNATNSQKTRKRKKSAGPEDLTTIIPVSHSTTESASTAVTENIPPLSTSMILLSSTPSKVVSNNPVTPISFPASYQLIGNSTASRRAISSEEISSRIEEAKNQAEEAASLAAASMVNSRGIWSQLVAQRDSGLVSEVETKLASAAVAAAAAASVAKAAAAAAKVASDVALQAKMMAEETIATSKAGNLTQNPESNFDEVKDLERLTPASILKGKQMVDSSSSVLSAARMAARKRVEAASAAAKQAQNIDAIVKAAELAAEAVSQAGAIISMGDPLPFRLGELIDAGPEDFWKLQHSGTQKLKADHLLGAEDTRREHSDQQGPLVNLSKVKPVNVNIMEKAVTECRVSSNDQQDPLVNQSKVKPVNINIMEKAVTECGVSSNDHQSVISTGKHKEGSVLKASSVMDDEGQRENLSTNQTGNEIQQGSLVEVVTDDRGLRGAWFSARVLDLKDKKAYICYDYLTDEGSAQLKEWVPCEGDGNTVPRIRIAHPITRSKHEGTKKRRREAVGNYTWEIGDHVDVWMRDGWWEGIITEKSQGDETKLIVHFPAGGDSSEVRAWNLRPSLIWKDGYWTKWSRESGTAVRESDARHKKRQRFESPEAKANMEATGSEKPLEIVPLEDSRKPEASKPLNLSAKDQVYSVGAIPREESKVKRKGLQKEGSRVVFGIPKPGKKRKFMDVSTNYVTDNKADKRSEGNDTLKFAKNLMPQQSRMWNSSSKVEFKGKQTGEPDKPRRIRSAKSQVAQPRCTTEKDTSSVSTGSISTGGDNGRGALRSVLTEKKPLKVASFLTRPGTTTSQSIDSRLPVPGGRASSKKFASAAEVVDKPTSSQDNQSTPVVPDYTEPRRSNRKIQPTSRLLEGLQSSLSISKIPSVSHDKTSRPKYTRGISSSRGGSRG